MAHIFISYAHEDTKTVLPLIRALESQKFSVWWDDKISPGGRIPAVIHKALDEVSCVIVVWSKLSVESNWVLDEAGYGRDRNILIPVIIDDCSPPLGFQQLLAQDLRGWSGNSRDPRIRKVFAAVRETLALAPGKLSRKPVTGGLRAREDTVLHYDSMRHQRVFLIVGSFNEEWQVSLNSQLMQALQQSELLCTVMVPSEDHSVEQQRSFLQSVADGDSDYLGGLVICSGWPDDLMPELFALVKQIDLPTVLVDRNPPKGLSSTPPNLSYAGVSDEKGGQLAADAVFQLSEDCRIRRILVIAGYAKRARYRAFQKKIRTSKKLKGCEVIITEDGRFDRWMAENVAYNFLTEANERRKPYDVIFCIANSMTIGCLDAIARVTNWRGAPLPKVIGYDGTATTRNFVENRRSPLVRIVVQDSKEIARAAIARLILLNQKKAAGTAKNVIWVDPYLYPRVERTSA